MFTSAYCSLVQSQPIDLVLVVDKNLNLLWCSDSESQNKLNPQGFKRGEWQPVAQQVFVSQTPQCALSDRQTLIVGWPMTGTDQVLLCRWTHGVHPNVADEYESSLTQQIVHYAENHQPLLICGPKGSIHFELVLNLWHQLGAGFRIKTCVMNISPKETLQSCLRSLESLDYVEFREPAKEVETNNSLGTHIENYAGSIANPGKPTLLVLENLENLPFPLQIQCLDALTEFQSILLNNKNLKVVTLCRKPFKRMVSTHTVMADILSLLGVQRIELLPLSGRIVEIESRLRERLAAKGQRLEETFTSEAIEFLFNYDWPGNECQLQQWVDHFASAKGLVGPEEFEELVHPKDQLVSLNDIDINLDLARVMDQVERHTIYQALLVAGGNRSKAAKLLNISRPTLYEKIHRLGI